MTRSPRLPQPYWPLISSSRAVLLLGLLASSLLSESAYCAAEDLPARERVARANFDEKLSALAAKCDELKLAPQAALTREWTFERDPNRQYIFTPDGTDPTKPDDNSPLLIRQWHRGFSKQRTAFAGELFKLAQSYAEAGDGTKAYQLLHEVLRHDPQHSDARRVLAPHLSFSDRVRRRAGSRTHRDFGWRKGKYWQIESSHYLITTSHSAQAGVDLARKLEMLHSVWQQVFFSYWSASESLAERMRGGNAKLGKRKKLSVVLFRDRQEYVEQLQKYEPQIGMSLGYYMNRRQTAFFYAGDDSITPTWFHEATHQLFQELGDAINDVGEDSNFWLVEGIAVYMESLVKFDGHCTLGGFDADRLQFARARALGGEFYMPLKELVALSREDLQKHEEIGRIYSQSAGIIHYLMNGDRGSSRAALIDLVSLLYLGRVRSDSLERLLDKPLPDLDEGYVEYLAVTDDDLKFLNPPSHRRNLAFGRTAVSDVGVKQLRGSLKLKWLDLSFTKITDDAIASVADAVALRQLNLDGTTIGDQSLQTIAGLSQLEELDLSNTRVTDAGLRSLSNLTKLKVLWLTNTSVSDTGLSHLEDLRDLEFLDVSQTEVTAEGFETLKKQLPKLNREE